MGAATTQDLNEEQKKMFEAYERYGRFASEFHQESDRGCAVLVVCVIEEALQNLIKAFVVDPAKASHFAPKGRLSFAIESAKLLGLISDHQAKCISGLVDVRNKFAHGAMENRTFASPDIAALVRKIPPAIKLPQWIMDEYDKGDPRWRFISFAQWIWSMLTVKAVNVKRLEPPPEPDPASPDFSDMPQ